MKLTAVAGLAAAPLFRRIFLLMLACVAVVQLLNFALLVAVQPPTQRVYLVGEIARALEQGSDPSGELVFTQREQIDPAIWAPRAQRIQPSLAKVMGVPVDRVEFGFVKPPFPQRAPSYDLANLPPTVIPPTVAAARAFIVLDDFVASYRRDDGSWVTVRPASHPFEYWRWIGLFWLIFSALLIMPFAWWLAQRLAKPFGVFAAAAERLGRDPRAPPLAMEGPPEIAGAAGAFNRMQARLNRYVDDRAMVTGAIAHDLRTPLMRLALRLEQAPDSLREACEGDIRDMEEMIAAALAYVRETGQPAVRQRLDLRSLVETVTDDLIDRGEPVSLDPGEPVILDGNATALKSMLSNLVCNALKYAGSAAVRLYRQGGQVAIEVLDRGPGVAPDDLDRLFEPFYRGERSRNRDTGGIGLGLASARAVARAHGGDVTLENRHEGGLRALVTLPV